MNRKMGVSPVIATVLLVSMVVIIGIIIFLLFRGMIGETVTKFEKNVELVCGDLVFDASYSASTSTLYITNDGVVPIYDMNVKLEGAGSHETGKLSEISSWKDDLGDNRLTQGGVFSDDISSAVGTSSKLILIPILLGSTDSGEKKEFVCDEGQYGVEINLEE